MSIYNINYDNKAVEWLPPDKRNPGMVGFVRALLAEIKYLAGKILINYRLGIGSMPFNHLYSYSIGDIITYQQVAYESLVNNNLNSLPPSANWQVYLPSHLGVNDRVKFNGQKLVLEYALNSYFFTNFRQPPLVSDIYISNIGLDIVSFVIGQNIGSTIALHDTGAYAQWVIDTPYAKNTLVTSDGLMYVSLINNNYDQPPSANWHQTNAIGYPSVFTQTANFSIHIPAAVYNALSTDPARRESAVRNFADRIVPAGLFYTITIY